MAIIGISASIKLENKDGFFLGYEYSYVANNYVKAISENNATPILLPIISDEELIENQIKLIDGLLISGGYDIDPQFYNEEPLEKLEAIYPKRDIYEIKLIHYALKHKKPILGICRGFQVLNVALGGSLYQDVSYRENTFIKHSQVAEPSQATHDIDICEDSILFQIAEKKTERVNSFHHLALKKIGNNLKVTAQAKDGVPEAIESTDKNTFILGVQFHPEMMFKNNTFADKIFKHFIFICNKKK